MADTKETEPIGLLKMKKKNQKLLKETIFLTQDKASARSKKKVVYHIIQQLTKGQVQEHL